MWYVVLECGESLCSVFFFFQAEDGIRDIGVTGVQTCALPICKGHKMSILVSVVSDLKNDSALCPFASTRRKRVYIVYFP